jgi:hypothetical protein
MLGRITLTALVFALVGCGASRTTFALYPSASAAFDRAGSDPKAVEIADRVIAAAGGQDKWTAVRQVRWSESIATGEAGRPPITFDEAWDRWNGRHYQRIRADAGDVVVMRSLYEASGTAYRQSGSATQTLPRADRDGAISNARERWEFDTELLLLPFLLEAPGAKLALVGEVPGEADQPPLDDLKVTFDSKDPTRTSTIHAMVNRTTNQIDRIAIVKAGDPDNKRIGYKLSSWVDVGPLKLATVYQNIGLVGEVVTFSKIEAAPEADETLYVPAVAP